MASLVVVDSADDFHPVAPLAKLQFDTVTVLICVVSDGAAFPEEEGEIELIPATQPHLL